MAKKKKKVNMSIFIPRLIFCGLILYLFISFLTQQFSFSRLGKEEKQIDRQQAEQQQLHEELEAEKEASSDPAYIERVARDKLGYMKPDERVFIDSKKAN